MMQYAQMVENREILRKEANLPRYNRGKFPYYPYVHTKSNATNNYQKNRGNVVFSIRTITTISPMAATIIGVVLGALVCGILYMVTIKKSAASLGFVYAGLTGAFTNTFLVMGGIYIFYKGSYAAATNVAVDKVLSVIMGVVTFNGVVESVVAAIIVTALGLVLMKVKTLFCDENREITATHKSGAAL